MSKDIINILVERDSVTREEALQQFKEIAEEVRKVLEKGSFGEAEDLVIDRLGLEPEYLMEFLW